MSLNMSDTEHPDYSTASTKLNVANTPNMQTAMQKPPNTRKHIKGQHI